MAEIAEMIGAQERLMLVMDMAAASGNLKKGAHRRHMRDLRRATRGTSQRRGTESITRSDADSTPQDPADFGIEVVVLKGVKTAPWPTAGG